MEHEEYFLLLLTLPFLIILFSVGKSLPWVPRWRTWSIILYSIFGGFSIHLYSKIRGLGPNFNRIPTSKYVHISLGINGVIGILAAVWTLIASILTSSVGKKKYTYKSLSRPTKQAKWQGSNSCFLLFITDLLTLGCLIPAAVYGTFVLPLRMPESGCQQPEYLESRLFEGIGESIGETSEGGCKRFVAVQYLGLCTIIAMGLQTLLLLRHVVVPAPLRAPLFRTITLLRSFVDFVSRTTKARTNPGSGSIDMAHGVSSKAVQTPGCDGAEKAECWSCAKLTCLDCRTARQVRSPRTAAHSTNCYAVCTKCYLLRCSVGPSPLSSTWHSEQLSLQHARCQEKSRKLVGVCSQCASLNEEEIASMRERKEEAVVRVMSRRRLRCSKCDTSLPKQRSRWWICGICHEECHWAGHTP